MAQKKYTSKRGTGKRGTSKRGTSKRVRKPFNNLVGGVLGPDQINGLSAEFTRLFGEMFKNNDFLLEAFKKFITTPKEADLIPLLSALYKDQNIVKIIQKFNPSYGTQTAPKSVVLPAITPDSTNKPALAGECVGIGIDKIIVDAHAGNVFAFFLGVMCDSDFFTKFFTKEQTLSASNPNPTTRIEKIGDAANKFLAKRVQNIGADFIKNLIKKLNDKSKSNSNGENYVKKLQGIVKAENPKDGLQKYLVEQLTGFLSEIKEKCNALKEGANFDKMLKTYPFLTDLSDSLSDSSFLLKAPMFFFKKRILNAMAQNFCNKATRTNTGTSSARTTQQHKFHSC